MTREIARSDGGCVIASRFLTFYWSLHIEFVGGGGRAGLIYQLIMSKIWLRSKASGENVKFLWTIFQPRTLSAEIPSSQKGVYLFYNVPSY